MPPSSRTLSPRRGGLSTRSGRRSGRRALTALGSGSVALALALGMTPSGAVGAPGDGGAGVRRGPDLSARLGADRSTPQTSDGVPGERVAPVPARLARARTVTNTTTAEWSVAPGVTFRRFDRNDSARGNSRVQLLTIDMATPGVGIDYAAAKKVAKTTTVDKLTARSGGVAGINGDFFDIGDTGAALGIGVSRARGLIQGPASGWNAAFYLDALGVPQVGGPSVTTTLRQEPQLSIAALNPPSVPRGGVAAYDAEWGRLDGYQVTDGQKARVRQVVIRGKRVVSNRTRLSDARVDGEVLIGRGKGAKRLASLRVGSRARLTSELTGAPPVAITGDRPILLGGVRQVINDLVMHPRTAIGIDRDLNRVLMVVVDGRQGFSRGATMVELAQLMTELGAEDALNLDGGGSSTMMARDQLGTVGVQNSPSDGRLRKVANGLVVTYDPLAVPLAPLPPAPPTPPAPPAP